MKRFSQFVFVALAVIVALVVVKECGYRQGAQEARAQQVDVSTDLAIKLLQAEAADSQKAFAQRMDSTQDVIATLRSRVRPVLRDTVRVTDSVYFREPVDSLIAAYEAGRQSDSLQLLFWQAQVAQRDSIISVLQTSRDGWRRAAQPSLTKRVGQALPWLAGAYLVGRLTK